ncbi:hypothetical protein GYMLUDRAFT_700480 [Collybiopsis luxurians FD-317 M1]|uniref:Cytochrome P450 n=1 Tax=Collybiopsis luxurians FD-317 M1 TaxID=944289 RepID=A0A0D0CIT6_9AGAR|nr:hypothetical protein GYMLUDRAFT_700480 [Collybiopsis luxurians FD-317 M1]
MYILLACFTLFYFAVQAIYRLFFHPLCRYPGPVLAAITGWYEAYHDIIRDGGLVAELEMLHQRLGPVIRIGPNILHFNYRQAYHDIYTHGSTLTKDPEFYLALSAHNTGSSQALCDPQEAKDRRALLGPLFSRKAVSELEHTIQGKVDKLVAALEERHNSESSAVALDIAFRACTTDIITAYCFAESTDSLDVPNFAHELLPLLRSVFTNAWFQRHFPFIFTLTNSAPQKIVLWLFPEMRTYLELNARFERQIDRIIQDPDSVSGFEHRTVFHYLLEQKGRERLSKQILNFEAFLFIGAGSETTASACYVGTFYALKFPSIRKRLFEELCEAWPDPDRPMPYAALEKQPYLTAFIKETLRLALGVIHPLPRVVGSATPTIGGLKIPPGTIVEMSQLFLHMNPSVFPDPHDFNPDRWLAEDTTEMMLDLSPFSKGPRICLGLNLAWCELYLVFGNMFRKLDMKLVINDDTYGPFSCLHPQILC